MSNTEINKTASFKVKFGEIHTVIVGAEPYTGSYNVTPTVEGTTLNTTDKIMREDVVVKPIPYYEVTNESGGNTVYIAKELE